jgi:hypothetical protein
MAEWQKVYEDTQEHRIEIVRAVLEENDIKSVSVNKKIALHGIGNLEVLVAADDVLRAIRIVNEEIKFE